MGFVVPNVVKTRRQTLRPLFFHSFQLAHCEEELNESKDLNVFLQDQIDEIKMQVTHLLLTVKRTLILNNQNIKNDVKC